MLHFSLLRVDLGTVLEGPTQPALVTNYIFREVFRSILDMRFQFYSGGFYETHHKEIVQYKLVFLIKFIIITAPVLLATLCRMLWSRESLTDPYFSPRM